MVAKGVLASSGVASIEEAGHILYEQARANLRVVPGEPLEGHSGANARVLAHARMCLCQRLRVMYERQSP